MERQRLTKASDKSLKRGVYVDADGYKAVLDTPDGEIKEKAFGGKHLAGTSHRKMAVAWL